MGPATPLGNHTKIPHERKWPKKKTDDSVLVRESRTKNLHLMTIDCILEVGGGVDRTSEIIPIYQGQLVTVKTWRALLASFLGTILDLFFRTFLLLVLGSVMRN